MFFRELENKTIRKCKTEKTLPLPGEVARQPSLQGAQPVQVGRGDWEKGQVEVQQNKEKPTKEKKDNFQAKLATQTNKQAKLIKVQN